MINNYEIEAERISLDKEKNLLQELSKVLFVESFSEIVKMSRT